MHTAAELVCRRRVVVLACMSRVLLLWDVLVLLYKALRSAGGIRRPLRLLRREQQCEADRGPRLIVGVYWRLENAKSPATALQENNPDATRVSIPRMCDAKIYTCLEACEDRAFVARMTNRHGHWACWTSACWMSMGGSKQQRGTCG